MDYLSSGLEKNIQKSSVSSEIWTKFFGDSEDNMAMSAVNEFFFDGSGAIILISSATSAAKAGMTAKRDETDTFTAGTLVKCKPHFRITAGKNPGNFINYHGSDIGIGFIERIPVIGKDLLDSKFSRHDYHLILLYTEIRFR